MKSVRASFYKLKHEAYGKLYLEEIQNGDVKTALCYLRESRTYLKAFIALNK